MAGGMDPVTIVKHLANGSLVDELCVVCLLPLTEDSSCENVWTWICKKDEEYCIADVLREICQIKILETDNYNVCRGCFQSASAAYKFYLQAKRSQQILYFYTDQLLKNIEDLDFTEKDRKQLLGIPVPVFTPEGPEFDYGFEGIGIRNMGDDEITETTHTGTDDNVVMIINDDETLLYSVQDGALQDFTLEKESDNEDVPMIVNKKRRKRVPMVYMSCLHCPVRYRFMAKLKKHEKKMHNAVIFICKICKLVTDKKDYYVEHSLTHSENYDDVMQDITLEKESYNKDVPMIVNENYDGALQNITLEKESDNEDVPMIDNENYDGALQDITLEKESDYEDVPMIVNKKTRKKRDPMVYMSCLHCPVRYRFMSKLKKHEKKMHNAVIFICNVCKLVTDKKDYYVEHSLTHFENYECTTCGAVYMLKASLIRHLKYNIKCNPKKWENGNTCEICGDMLENEAALEEHHALRHTESYTCFYCGRMYKGRKGFEKHIQKHEKYLKSNNHPSKKQEPKSKPPESEKSIKTPKRSICGVCQKSFVDKRALLWHQRLHNNDKPFLCNICGRGFVSANRVSQHRQSTHCLPTHRCPLCPALFHLRWYVNAHLKKVHLNKDYKGRHRTIKHKDVFWRTETVPIEALSVSIQNAVLEIQTSRLNAES